MTPEEILKKVEEAGLTPEEIRIAENKLSQRKWDETKKEQEKKKAQCVHQYRYEWELYASGSYDPEIESSITKTCSLCNHGEIKKELMEEHMPKELLKYLYEKEDYKLELFEKEVK